MSLSHRLTEIHERSFSLGAGIDVNTITNFDIVTALGLNPKVGTGGVTSQGTTTTTESILSPLSSVITLADLYYPTTAQKLYVASTSAQDNPSGTGAAIVGINGLDANYNLVSDFVTLDGQTPVETNVDFIRANDFFVLTFGTGNVITSTGERFADGDIYLGGSNTFASGIPADPMLGINSANVDDFLKEIANRESIYTVPDGKFLIVKDYQINAEANKSTRSAIHVRLFGEDFFRMLSPTTLTEGTNDLSTVGPFPIPPRSDIQIRFKNTQGTSFTSLAFIGVLYDQ